MRLNLLHDSRGCTQCTLGTGPTNPGLPTRAWDGFDPEAPRKTKALLLLGKCPGVEEDSVGVVHSGPTGVHTNNTFIRGANLADHADCWVGNYIRCKPPNADMAMPGGAYKACHQHFEADLRALDAMGYTEVVVLCMGTDAVRGVMGEALGLGNFPQGSTRVLAGKPRVVFATYLPAILLVRADPAKLNSIDLHLRMLHEYLSSGTIRNLCTVDCTTVSRTNRVPPGVTHVALDIETYGKLSTMPPQRFFHPAKSMHWDGVPRNQLVVTAGMAWRDPTNGVLCNRHYVLASARERDEFYDDLSGLARPDCTITGANLLFDIMYLMEDSDTAKLVFEPFSPLNPRLEDVLVLSFLDDDTRPERGLKTISRVLRTLEFGEEHLGNGEYIRHTDPFDPELGKYQIEDVYATLTGAELLKQGYPAKYGPTTAKGSEFSLQWYSDLMYLVLSMSRAGLRFDVGKLRTLHDRLETRLIRWEDAALRRYGTALRRTGAGPRCSAYMDCVDVLRLKPCKTPAAQAKRLTKVAAIVDQWGLPEPTGTTPGDHLETVILRTIQQGGLASDPRVVRTPGGKLSCGAENIELCRAYASGDDRKFLRTWSLFHTTAKLVGTYLKPMLGLKPDPTRDDLNKALIGEYAFPTWRLVPSSDDSGEEGGTQQVRITCKGPALQTAPPAVEKCEISRWDGGCIMSKDERQIELRVPVMYSREEHIAELFRSGVSPYEHCAEVIVGHPVRKKTHPREYQMGKIGMLAIQFRASPKKIQETTRKELGIEKPLGFWETTVKSLYANRAGLIAQQDRWIAEAKERHFLEVPFIGVSRSFVGSGATIDRTYIPTIVNFPIQSLAAALTLSAQIAAERWLRRGGYRTRLVKNTYDEGVYDVPPGELEVVGPVLTEFYRVPPLYTMLVEAGYYPIPLDCSTEIR